MNKAPSARGGALRTDPGARGAAAAVAGRVWGGVAPLWGVVRLLPGVSRGLTAAVGLGTLLGAVLPVAATVAAGGLVGAIPAAVAAGPDSAEEGVALALLAVVGGLFIAIRALGTVRGTLASVLGQRLNEHLRERVMVAVNRPIGIAHLEDSTIRDRIESARGVGAGWTAGSTVVPLTTLMGAWLVSFGSALVLLRFNALLAVGLFLTWVVVSNYLGAESVRARKVAANAAKYVRRNIYLRDLVLTPGAGKEVRVWGMLRWLIGQYNDEWLRVMGPIWRERTHGHVVYIWAVAVGQVVSFVALALIGVAAARGEIDLAALVTYVGAVGGVMTASTAVGGDAPALLYGPAAVPAVLELERMTAEAERRETLTGTMAPAEMPREEIRFEGVSFRYAGREDDVLRELSLTIPAGRSLAIVGANGAGKTTLVKLIARLYDPTEGRVTVDGVPLNSIDPRAWQRRVSAIFQDFIQYHLTARENVAFGAIERADDKAALEEAARLSGALELIEGLPLGWETVLSRQFTGGTDLSGGQWQRVALARALFAVNNRAPAQPEHRALGGAVEGAGARVLILDEPTANLDVRAEAALYDRFLEITKGLTTILISHRFSTVRRADRIVVIAEGRVAEEGTHDELMAARGRYAEMFTLQASRFVDGVVDELAEATADG